jgi:four helix bundle protein
MSKGTNMQKGKSAKEQNGKCANAQNLEFEQWQVQVPKTIRNESFWNLIAYQKALCLYELIWEDTNTWLRDMRGRELARQIIRSADSICSNIEEGYGRGFGKELLYFYRIALGSARETKGHYYRAKVFVSPDILEQRLTLASEVVALLLTEINRQKRR